MKFIFKNEYINQNSSYMGILPEKELSIVLGMHRSGTSVLTKSLVDLGFYPGKKLIPPNEGNPKGYWEDIDIYNFNNEILSFLYLTWDKIEDFSQRKIITLGGIIWEMFGQRAIEIINRKLNANSKVVIKDPRFSILLPFWNMVFDQIDAEKYHFLILRNPLDVAKSIVKRNNMDEKHALLLWYYYNVSCLFDIDQKLCLIHFENLIDKPDTETIKIVEYINADYHKSSKSLHKFLGSFIDKNLQHHNSSIHELNKKASFLPELLKLYNDLSNKNYILTPKVKDKLIDKVDFQNLKNKKASDSHTDLVSSLFYNCSKRNESAQSIQLRHNDGNNHLSFQIQSNNIFDEFNLFLCDRPCLIDIHSCLINLKNEQFRIANFEGNFIYQNNNLFVFGSNIPNIKFNLPKPEKILSVDIELHIDIKEENIAGYLIPAQHFKLDKKSLIIQEQQQRIDNLSSEQASFNSQKNALLKKVANITRDYKSNIAKLEKTTGEKIILNEEKKSLLAQLKNTQSIVSDLDQKTLSLKNQLEEDYKERIRITEENRLLNKQIDNTFTIRSKLENKLLTIGKEKEKVEAELDHQKQIIYRLSKDNKALRNSLSWRITWPIRMGGRLIFWVLSRNSGLLKDFKYGIELLRREGITNFFKRLFWYVRGKRLIEDIYIAKNRIKLNELEVRKSGSMKTIVFPETNNPLVSIIIPVHNQWKYTYNCLKSIRENTLSVDYEIIIADDASTDETINIINWIKNINIIRNKNNLHFIRNCNNAATKAKGKYLHILNNDIIVHPGWLEALIKVVEKDEKVGIVGSKLIYPDGRLQEAGGIIWNDASGWNYGRLDDPEKPEYNYLKEVDYVSGASLLIKKELWDQLQGFDEHFAPAYYEDTDLAFKVRKRGYKVVYQPLSVVTHFEGVSHGKDETEGIKKYQADNRVKFIDKWSDVLAKEHSVNGKNVFTSRERSFSKKQILVIDHYVPHYDNDAGSRSTFSYLKLLVKMGFNVKFIGDNFYRHEPYTTSLQQLGIEVLYGNHYQKNINHWIKENGHYFDIVFLHRMHITPKYLDTIKSNTKAKLIYIGHDLQFLSSKRKFEVTKDEAHLNDVTKFKQIETHIFKTVDIVFPFSTYEVPFIKEIVPEKVVQAVPVYFYENFFLKRNGFEGRKDILFVSGFGHPPNVDAFIWFVDEIFPMVRKHDGNIKLYVVGSKPTEAVKKKASESIVVTGFVSDKELENYYNTCKVAILPLRIGAGVKGKLLEAFYYQIPTVITPVAAEGVPEIEKYSVIANTPVDFAKEIITLNEDSEKWLKLSKGGKEIIQKYYTEDAAKGILQKLI